MGPYFTHMSAKIDVRLLKSYLPVSKATTSLAQHWYRFSIKIFRVYSSWLLNTKKDLVLMEVTLPFTSPYKNKDLK
jgi:hypothetical protein